MLRRLPRILTLTLVLLLLLTALSGAALAAPSAQESIPATAVTVPARMNVRSGPATTYRVIGSVPAGTAVKIIAENADGTWVRGEIDGFDGPVWLAKWLLELQEATQNETSADRAVAASTSVTFTRPISTTAIVAATTPITASATVSATVAAEEVADTPIVEAPIDTSAGPVAVTTPPRMNVRRGPGTEYPVATGADAGTQARIVGIGPDHQWYQVELAGQEDKLWISAGLTTLHGSLDAVPQLSEEEIPPRPQPVVPVVREVNTPAPTGGGSFGFGIQAHAWQMNKYEVVEQIRGINFSWMKQQIRWETVETSPGAINWGEMDQIINVMADWGISVLFSVVTAPQWTRPSKHGTEGPPEDFNHYADFVGKIAARYCGKLSAIEVWNEQNLQREWQDFPLDSGLYMDLLKRSYTSIKSACPSILVISGAPTPAGNTGVAIDDIDYLRGMYSNGLAQYSDGIGVHPSGFANPPDVTVQDFQQGRYSPPPSHFNHRSFYFRSTMEESRRVMVENGDINKRLWPTEFGWASTPSPQSGYEYASYNTEEEQAEYIVRSYQVMKEWGWVGAAFLWNLNFPDGEQSAFRILNRLAYARLQNR